MNATDCPTTPGVYLLTHRVTRDTYVGKADNLRTRLMSHTARFASGRHENIGVETVLKEHGPDFEITVLEETTREDRRAAELRWIDKIKPTLNQKDTAAAGCKPRHKHRNWKERPTTVPITGSVPKWMYDALKEIADADDRSIAYVVGIALREYLDRHAKKRK